MFHVVEDEVERGRGGDSRHSEALEADDIGMVEAAEQYDLPHHEPHALRRVHTLHPHLLQRHHPPRHQVPRLVHIAVCARPNLETTERIKTIKRKIALNFLKSTICFPNLSSRSKIAHLLNLLERVGAARRPAV